ncbi:MAG TPA: hypothetical protein VFS44_11870 [Gemmatimonadaceae bacterium]|nr:hypothetical protein [Gemmatimonadaceae bacterium]
MERSRAWENHQRELDPDRDVERDRVSAGVAATLRARGVELTGDETSDQLADILSAVERFEAAVSEIGGDRMVNDAYSSQPEDAAFVLPRRAADESATQYADRVLRAARRLARSR